MRVVEWVSNSSAFLLWQTTISSLLSSYVGYLPRRAAQALHWRPHKHSGFHLVTVCPVGNPFTTLVCTLTIPLFPSDFLIDSFYQPNMCLGKNKSIQMTGIHSRSKTRFIGKMRKSLWKRAGNKDKSWKKLLFPDSSSLRFSCWDSVVSLFVLISTYLHGLLSLLLRISVIPTNFISYVALACLGTHSDNLIDHSQLLFGALRSNYQESESDCLHLSQVITVVPSSCSWGKDRDYMIYDTIYVYLGFCFFRKLIWVKG